MGDIDKSREVYSREGDNSSRFEAKTVSWIDHIFKLKCLIDLYLFRKKLLCAFIDYRKAFDSVDRVLLCQKLLRTCIDGRMVIVI